MPVVDASALAVYLAGGEGAERIRARLLSGYEPLWAPHLIDAEVGRVLRRAALRGKLRPAIARAALVDLSDLPIRRAGHAGLLERAWQLRANLSFYDALYVALAELLDMPLLTLDARLRGAPGVKAAIEVC